MCSWWIKVAAAEDMSEMVLGMSRDQFSGVFSSATENQKV
jgi:hypothetical protein